MPAERQWRWNPPYRIRDNNGDYGNWSCCCGCGQNMEPDDKIVVLRSNVTTIYKLHHFTPLLINTMPNVIEAILDYKFPEEE